MVIVDVLLRSYFFFDDATFFHGRYDEIPFYDWEDYEFVRFDTTYVYRPRHFIFEYWITNITSFRYFLGLLCILSLLVDSDFFYAIFGTVCYNFWLYKVYLVYILPELYPLWMSTFCLILLDYTNRVLSYISYSGILLLFIIYFILLFGTFDTCAVQSIFFDDYLFYVYRNLSIFEIMQL